MSEPISGKQAKEAAQRLINSHFGNADPARMSTPARATDDDLTIMAYIEQAEARRASPTPEGGDDRENLMERAREIAADDLSAMTASWLDTQAFARALLSSPRVEEVRREALNDALFDLLELAIDVRVEGASIVLFHCSSGAAKARLVKAQTALSPPVVKDTP